MATGFKDIQVPSFDEDAGYETIFEKLNKIQPRTCKPNCKIIGYDKIGMGKQLKGK